MINFFILSPGFDVTLPSNGAAFLWFFISVALFMRPRVFRSLAASMAFWCTLEKNSLNSWNSLDIHFFFDH